MKLFLAGSPSKNCINYVFDMGYNKLYSYENDKKLIEEWVNKKKENPNNNASLFVDSGAFTAWTRGKSIDVDKYINFINERSEFICLYGQVDSIPGDRVHGATQEQVLESAEKTWQNYLYMYSKMKNPKGLLYTFHVGEPLSFLRRALEWRDEKGNPIEYIALGGMVGKTKEIRRKFLDSCYFVIKKSSNPNVKVHAFGMTDFELLSQYPVTSADSTSWVMTGANGGIMTDFGIVVVSEQQKNNPNYYAHLNEELQESLKSAVSKHLFTLDSVSKDSDARIMLNARYMSEKSKSIEYTAMPSKRRLF